MQPGLVTERLASCFCLTGQMSTLGLEAEIRQCIEPVTKDGLVWLSYSSLMELRLFRVQMDKLRYTR